MIGALRGSLFRVYPIPDFASLLKQSFHLLYDLRMSRPVNEKRPEELREAIVRFLMKHGLADLSLRPLAKAVGSSPRVLLYYFGSKEKIVVEILAEVRRQQLASFGQIDAATFAEACQIVWKRMSAPDSEPIFRLFFEAYGMALRRPKQFKDFLRATVEDWLTLVAEPLVREGHTRRQARAFATVVLAGLRGFMLDYCNTGDRKRVDDAVGMWLDSLDSMLAAGKKDKV
jgi:AcrR family transcriptional regulator